MGDRLGIPRAQATHLLLQCCAQSPSLTTCLLFFSPRSFLFQMRNWNRSPVHSRPPKLKQTREANSKTKQKRRADTHARALTLFSENGWSRDPSAHLTASACLRPAGRQTSTLHPAALAHRLGRQRRRIRRRRRLGSKASLPVFFQSLPASYRTLSFRDPRRRSDVSCSRPGQQPAPSRRPPPDSRPFFRAAPISELRRGRGGKAGATSRRLAIAPPDASHRSIEAAAEE